MIRHAIHVVALAASVGLGLGLATAPARVTQAETVEARLPAKAGGGAQGPYQLVAGCDGTRPYVYVAWGEKLAANPSQVTLQSDATPAVALVAAHINDDTATLFPDALAILRAFGTTNVLTARVATTRQGTVTALFSLDGGGSIAKRIVDACGINLAGATTDLVSPKGTNDLYATFFETIVFGSEIKGLAAPIVRKWTVPIRYRVISRDPHSQAVADRFLAQIQVDTEELTKFSQVKFERVKGDGAGANYIIMFSDTAHLLDDARKYLADNPHDIDQIKDANCFFLTYADPLSGQMLRGRVIANADLDDQELTHCLLEELTQSLGLPNDDYRVAPSLFNDGMKLTSLSIVDKALIRVLYDPRLAPGTPRAQALTIARAVLAELNPGG